MALKTIITRTINEDAFEYAANTLVDLGRTLWYYNKRNT